MGKKKKTPTAKPPPELGTAFPKNLTQLREARGLSKSDLARQLFGTKTDTRGYKVPRAISQISAWEAGRTIPTTENIMRLSRYFEVNADALAPHLSGRDASRKPESMSLRLLDDGQAHVQINVVLDMAPAMEVMSLIHQATSLRDESNE